MAPQRRERLSVNLQNAADSGELNRRSQQQTASHLHRRDDAADRRRRVPESRTDRAPAYASTSSRRMPQQPTFGLELTTEDIGVAAVPIEEASGREMGKSRIGRYSGQGMRTVKLVVWN
ncbi:hypothetical protein NYR97_05445 [Xanthomonas hydrangeae]|uniref:Uncharacterized protein n=1 Tax=Xanthomonas hydrangeae TaxID=2775159 RepID=A0AAU0BFT1_9XANT|nr:hypothetical protein [Xanthomonas hydrangeae]WOB50836.1 hypothetical protein NYR97_05445 [Xanthomonas hydrangeae]